MAQKVLRNATAMRKAGRQAGKAAEDRFREAWTEWGNRAAEAGIGEEDVRKAISEVRSER